MSKITDVKAHEILDSRGYPTLEVEVYTGNGSFGRASVPSGASIGQYEALEQRDDDPTRYLGKGVLNSVSNINKILKNEIIGKEVLDQIGIDRHLIILDGSENKQNLGANTILGISLAIAHAGANSEKLPLYQYIRKLFHLSSNDYIMPVCMFNILNGGKHASRSTDIQEFMVVPHGFESFRDSLRAGAEIYHCLGSLVGESEFGKLVGDEGGYARPNTTNTEALKLLISAIEKAGYKPSEQVSIAIDSAANEFYDYEDGKYLLKTENKIFSTAELIAQYKDWAKQFPIISFEDPFFQDDWEGFSKLTADLGANTLIVGDDIFAANDVKLKEGVAKKACNAILVKINQIGTLTETIELINLAFQNKYKAIISNRSGETEDTTISDLVVALNSGLIKAGSTSRGERTAKYNQLLRIEDSLAGKAKFAKLTIP